jgi:hypothetical protein
LTVRHRFFVASAVAASVAIASLGTSVAGQGAASARAAKTTAPRTSWGKPDLQGVWDFRTVTPLERPKELTGKETLSANEAADFESRAAVANDRDRNVPAGNVGDYNQFWYDRGTQVALTKRTSLIVDPPDGRIPALTPEAERQRDAVAQARKGLDMDAPTRGGWVNDLGPGGLRVRCILGFNAGPPMTPSAYNNNFQLFQTADHVVILNEMIHDARIIPLDGRPHLNLRLWAGDSRARWQGDTLVIDTVNFKAPTLMTTGELSVNTHLTEKFTRLDADTLLYEFTVDDPTTWTKPWTVQVPMARSREPMYEYACHEGNYSVPNILAGARQREAAEESARKSGR